MTANPNRVDVVVPCYNYARFLPRCVESVLSQVGVEVRVLVIDDASTDDTPDIARGLCFNHPNVEYRRHETNKGHIATYNEGLLEWASAPYTVLISADDTLSTGSLSVATELMNRHCDVGMVYGRAVVITENDREMTIHETNATQYRVIKGETFLKRCYTTFNPVPTPAAVVRTELQQFLGGYRSDLPHSGDLEMWMRFATESSIGVIDRVQAYYRRHGDNMSIAYSDVNLIRDRREYVEACVKALGGCQDRFPESPNWLQELYDRIGLEAFWAASNAFDNGHTDDIELCLEFAREFRPELVGSKAWRRFRAKRLLGTAVWRRAKPLVDLLRGRHEAASISCCTLSAGRRIGWWPDEYFDSGILIPQGHGSS